MSRYVIQRTVQAVFALWAAFTVTFFILYALPSDPVSIMLRASDEDISVSQEKVDQLNQEFGFDKPILIQYVTRMGAALTGDLGTSVQTRQPVTQMIGEALPETLKLTGLAMLFSIVAGFFVATIATMSRSIWLSGLFHGFPALGFSVPSFWIGLLLLQLFSFQLGWFPPLGNRGFSSLVLPAITLAIPTSALIAQILIRSLEQIRKEPYIQTAIATGASPWRIQIVHIARNAALPALTLLGLSTGGLLAGAVVTETVFSRAGLGRLTQNAVTLQDIPVVAGLTVVAAAFFVSINLLVDLLYPLLDPRIDTRKRSR
ncbi:ABC transporter permease [Brucellaceae bacterium C25G]